MPVVAHDLVEVARLGAGGDALLRRADIGGGVGVSEGRDGERGKK
jgi:hypothetical protein